jgi:hypothetical protein
MSSRGIKMTYLRDYISYEQSGDAVGNDARLDAALAAVALDGVLEVPAGTIVYDNNLPGNRVLSGFAHVRGAGKALSVFVNNNPTKPHFQIGAPNVVSEDGGMHDIQLIRPSTPLFSTVAGSAGATPALEPLGTVARYDVSDVQIKNCGRGIVFKNAGGTCFGWDIQRLYGSCVGSLIYVERAFGMHMRNSLFNNARADSLGVSYYFDAAMVEIVGEVDGFEIAERSVANTAGYGLLWSHSTAAVTGVKIGDRCWYDKAGKAGVWIAPMGSGRFYRFNLSFEAWGGGAPDNVPGAASAVVIETRHQDDVRDGEINVLGTNIRGAAISIADRSASGVAGRVRALQMSARSFTGSQAYPSGIYQSSIVEFGGARHLDCSVMFSEGSGHVAPIGNQGNGANLWTGNPCRIIGA